MREVKLDGRTPDITQENIDKLTELFPEVAIEGKIDIEKLQQLLGEYAEDKPERYNFTWNGKSRALRISQTPSTGTLRPCKDESEEWNTTQNLYIEGDNLEVLKLLQKSYHGKVKMIYIDPPYNTGGDFVYKDDFKDNIKNYKEITGQVDGEGKNLSTNAETSGRYHTDWLNMMYPRLRLARNLLTDDGVMFISIDEYEFSNLVKLVSELYGENNLDILIWRKNGKQGNTKKISRFKTTHEYIAAVYRNKMETEIGKVKLLPNWKGLKTNADNDPRGNWESGVISRAEEMSDPNSKNYYSITLPSGRVMTREFFVDKNAFQQYVRENKIYFPKDGDGVPRLKIFENEEQEYFFDTIVDEMGTFTDARNEIADIFGNKDIYDTPKTVKLLKELVRATSSKDNIILDFFSGSATTAHAVMKLNAEDGGNRKFIMVQLPEPCDEKSEAYKAGFKTIAEIGKERIRRAGKKIKEEHGEAAKNLDIGFKVLKLDNSNIRRWNPDPEDLQTSLEDHLENFVSGRTELDVVYEIMLKYGLDLTYPVEEYDVAGQKVYAIGFGMLMICLGDQITTQVAEGILKLIKELEPESARVVCRDNGFASDSEKTNVKEIFNLGGIEEFISI